ncbi:hypothetical protein APHACPA_0784 [Rickettsia amblyommatis str. Ac/Pa]|uniref:Uncharacterized protein n=1 Tax=Rickettsia amblyommatis str. Ac/Pa TaxID=1359164 RepID=A0A0F3N160_RICAM|nr:hypothetical protein APHACPA_0784 [Rickettsia amblyommatis str. Ac/Pa]
MGTFCASVIVEKFIMNMHKHNIRYIILDPFRLNGVGSDCHPVA